MPNVVVEALQLSRPQGSFRLGPVSLSLAAGSRTALVGPSGSGKTTLLRCLAGLESPSHGRILFGERLLSEGAHQHVPPAGRGIGFVFQDGALWPHLDAAQHLRFVRPSLTSAAAIEQLARVGLGDKAKRKPAQLSGGEAQRLALARALATDPELLLLDEPLGAVDVHLRDELALLVRGIATERALTVVVVTHDRDEALAMADDLAVMRDGRIVEHGAADELLHAPRTAFTARFLGRAACLPLHRDSAGVVRSALGIVTLPRGAASEDYAHVVLPGDLEVQNGDGAHLAEVLQVRRDLLGGPIAVVSIDGQPTQVRCGADSGAGQGNELRDQLRNPHRNGLPVELKVGMSVPLSLRGAPRLLPLTATPGDCA